MRIVNIAFVSVCVAAGCRGQSAAAPTPTGTVTGHVFCADTQRPARMAEVKLVPVPAKTDPRTAADTAQLGHGERAGNPVETDLDGSFTISNVKPGEYYLVVDKAGYLLPLGQFSSKELTQPDDETKVRLAKAVHAIKVNGYQTVTEEVRLERGGSVSGMATYDDGTPASGLAVKILAKTKAGKWEELPLQQYRGGFHIYNTDDQGRYRVNGLPPGEYVTEVDLTLSDHEISYGPMPNNPGGVMEMHLNRTRFSLPIYSGSQLRRQNAEPYKLAGGEERTGADVVFPLAKLHRVSGQVLAKDGHVVNDGRVELVWADDGSKMTEAPIQASDSAFHLEFVPEGEFTLKATGARDVTRVQVENAAGYTPRFHEETKPMRSYGESQQPLLVKGEMSDVTMTVPAATAASGSTAP